jgi:hypothetical protein
MYFVGTLIKKECSNKPDDSLIIIDYKHGEFILDKGCRRGNVVLAEKDQKVVPPDSAMSTRRPIARKQVLLDPINNRPGVHVKEAADLVCCVDGFVRHLGFSLRSCNHTRNLNQAGEHVPCPTRRLVPHPKT